MELLQVVRSRLQVTAFHITIVTLDATLPEETSIYWLLILIFCRVVKRSIFSLNSNDQVQLEFRDTWIAGML